MLDEVLEKQNVLGLPNRPEIISLDGGYGTGEMAAPLLDRGVLPHMPLQAGPEMNRCPRGSGRRTNLPQRRRRREGQRGAGAKRVRGASEDARLPSQSEAEAAK